MSVAVILCSINAGISFAFASLMLVVPRFYITFAYVASPTEASGDKGLMPISEDTSVGGGDGASIFSSRGRPYPFGPRGPYLFRCIGAMSIGLAFANAFAASAASKASALEPLVEKNEALDAFLRLPGMIATASGIGFILLGITKADMRHVYKF